MHLYFGTAVAMLLIQAALLRAGNPTVTWDGGGDGTNWSDAANWSNDTLPAESDVIEIDVVDEQTITVNAIATVAGLTCAENLTVANRLKVTGPSDVSGTLSIASGATLEADGAAASLSASGAVSAAGTLIARNGGLLSLPNLTAYTFRNRSFLADGEGSTIALPGLMTLEGSQQGYLHTITARDGGVIDLSNVTASTGYIRFDAIGASANQIASIVDLSSLVSFEGYQIGNGGFRALEGGDVRTPVLAEMAHGLLELDGDSSLDLAVLVRIYNVRVDLTGVALDLPLVTDFDASEVRVENGASFTLPNLASYNPVGWRFFHAIGHGSLVAFPAVTALDFTNVNMRVNFEAQNGGRFDLSAVETFIGIGEFSATGKAPDESPAVIDLSSLTSARGWYAGALEFIAKQGGQLLTGALASFTNGEIDLDGQSAFDAGQLAGLDDSSVLLSAGAALALPLVTSYENSGARFTTLQASGPGTSLLFPNLATLQSADDPVEVEAVDGGRVEMPSLVTQSGYVWFDATGNMGGSPSTIDLSSLPAFQGLNWNSGRLLAEEGGRILSPALAAIRDGSLVLAGSDGSIDTSLLATVEDAGFQLSGGAALTLPLVTSATSAGGATIQAEGSDTRLNFPNLTDYDVTTANRDRIEALDGGRIDLPALVNQSGPLVFLSQGKAPDDTPSAIDLGALTQFEGSAPGSGQLLAWWGGHILTPVLETVLNAGLEVRGSDSSLDVGQLSTLENSNVRISGGAQLALPLVTSYTNSNNTTLAASDENSVLSFPNLTDLHGSLNESGISVAVSRGAIIDLPALVNQSGNVSFSANLWEEGGIFPTINLPSLTVFTGISPTYAVLSVAQQGRILAPSLQSVHHAKIEVGGDQSFIDLSSLSNIDSSSPGAHGGATLVLPLVTSYTTAHYASLTASGSGSVLSLPNLRAINIPAPHSLELRGTNSGEILLEGLAATTGNVTYYTRFGGSVVHPPLADILWTGDGDGTSWEDPGNWSDGTVPTSTDNLFIEVDGDPVIVISSAVTITSLECAEALTIAGGSLTVTGGESIISGPLVLASGTTLAARNAATTLEVTGPASVNDASLFAQSGATLRINDATTYNAANSAALRAQGQDSLLSLPSLLDVNGDNDSSTVTVEALDGGRLELPMVGSSAGRVTFRASDTATDGTPSTIDLSSLQIAQAAAVGASRIVAELGGRILTPLLASLSGGEIRLDGESALGLAQLSLLRNSSVFVSGGASLALPLLTSYSTQASATLEARGPATVLDLGSLTSLSGPIAGTLTIRAAAGGRVALADALNEDGNITLIEPQLVFEEPAGTALAGNDNRDFGGVFVGDSSAPRTIMIRNTGTVSLDVTPAVAGTHPDDFTLDLAAFTARLAPDESTTLDVSFAPFDEGARSAVLRVTSVGVGEDVSTSDQFGLLGVGLAPLELAPEDLLLPGTGGGGDQFGNAVAISGDTVVVGAWAEDSGVPGDPSDDSMANAGAAYVFVREGGSWVQKEYLKDPSPQAGAEFGRSVAISGDTIVVGARMDDNEAGSAYVFVRNGEVWGFDGRLQASNADGGDRFGVSVAVSGGTVLVGAGSEDGSSQTVDGPDNNDAEGAGAAYVFVRDNSSWRQQAYLKADNALAGDGFGWSVALDGNVAVVGAIKEDSGMMDSGAAYVYRRDAETWQQEAYLKAQPARSGADFGYAVSIFGETICVGAPSEGETGLAGAGAAYVFEREGDSWVRTARLLASNRRTANAFGLSVAVSGRTVLVGSPFEGPGNVYGKGAAYAFTATPAGWPLQHRFEPAEAQGTDMFSHAYSLAISGDTVVAGSYLRDRIEDAPPLADAGAAFTFLGTVPSAAPLFTVHPQAEQTVPGSTSATLTAGAVGVPSPSYQWFRGASGDISQPVAGATSHTLTTPALFAPRSYWVRASNSAGSADSNTAAIRIQQIDNADLGSLALSNGVLSPDFAPFQTSYDATVPHLIDAVSVTATPLEPGAALEINGITTAAGSPSAGIPLVVGSNVIPVVVTALDAATTRTYTINMTRSPPTAVATGPASDLASSSAVLHGTITPNAEVEAYFEFGRDTNYGSRTASQLFGGSDSLPVDPAVLSGLEGSTIYHYRLVAEGPNGITPGASQTFTTAPDPPFVVTGNPVAITDSAATLVGLVDTHGAETTVYFEWGLTPLYTHRSADQVILAGAELHDVLEPIGGLISRATYHVRLVASNAAGTVTGSDLTFAVDGSNTGTGVPTAAPDVTTGQAVGVDAGAATLLGAVSSNGGGTIAYFEYEPVSAGGVFAQRTAIQGVGNAAEETAVSLPATGLLPGIEFRYRLVAENSLGRATGAEQTFVTDPPAPVAETGAATALTTTSVRVDGAVRSRGGSVEVWIDYGTDRDNLSTSIRAVPANVTGENRISVSATLPDLRQGVRYHYQVRATEPDDGDPTDPPREARGTLRDFDVASLSGIFQMHPAPLAPDDRQGLLTVTTSPGGIGGGWRFAGEPGWRASGETATGLTTGDRVIEYRPAAGHTQPPNEPVFILSGAPDPGLQRAYTASETGSGLLTVAIKPDSLAATAQWRLFGETDGGGSPLWRDSGDTATPFVPGNYLIECNPVNGWSTPPPTNAQVLDGQTTALTITYFLAEAVGGDPATVLDFGSEVSAPAVLPYPFVGQIRSDAGSGSGFVVRPRVVATAGHVLFDDGTLSAATGVRWHFQQHAGIHEPLARTPRGFYLMTGYEAQRALENSPGESTPQSQHLDAGAMYFFEDISRGGFSGYLASDNLDHEFLVSEDDKTLVGYPVDAVSDENLHRMHATPPKNVAFTRVQGDVRPDVPFRTYQTEDIESAGGASGGPLCILHERGTYYPAAIYLGGSNQTVVRAIDSEVAALFGLAESSSKDQPDQAGGTLSMPVVTNNGTPGLGSLQVFIEPEAARAAGAGWRINSQAPYQLSGARLDHLNPADYTLEFAGVPGFLPAIRPLVSIARDELTTLTFTYEVLIPPPVITSPAEVVGTRGSPLSYQIQAANAPDTFGMAGPLPLGMMFDPATGRLSGTPQEAGRFEVDVTATNAGGADRKTVAVVSRPVLADQQLTAPEQVPLAFQIASSESGPGVSFAATGLPPGLALDPSTGRVAGTPELAGLYHASISVTRRAATATATLTISITGSPPQITLQPPATSAVEFGQSATLTVAAGGDPAPAYRWYQGLPGDTSTPVPGGTSATLITPAVTAPGSFWVRASSVSGTADSLAAIITVLPSTDSALRHLLVSGGQLSPGFSPGILHYTATVPNFVASTTLTPTAASSQAAITVAALPVTSGQASQSVPLQPGDTIVPVEVTAGDGISTTSYQVTITRSAAAEVSTGIADGITDLGATLHGTATPRGPATVYFEFGTTTAYGNATPPRLVNGPGPFGVQAALNGLSGDTTYHFRLCLETSAGTICGDDAHFTTGPPRPLVVTGSAVLVTTAQATLTGAVDPRGLPADVWFEWGSTSAYGNMTPVEIVPLGAVSEVRSTITGLTPQAVYHYRLVARHRAGQPDELTVAGADRTFEAVLCADCGDGVPESPPSVTTGLATDITQTTAVFQGTANPNDGNTEAWFEYWEGLGPQPDPASRLRTASTLVGNGLVDAAVTQTALGLVPATTYSYWLCARNGFENPPGTAVVTRGEVLSVTAGSLAPLVSSAVAEALEGSASQVRISGLVHPQGGQTEAFVEYWTDEDSSPIRVTAGMVAGDSETDVSTILQDLLQFEIRDPQAGQEVVTYFFRLGATNDGGTTLGPDQQFQLGALLGLRQQFPPPVAAEARSGQLLVNLVPAVGAWRFAGEPEWRTAGAVLGGLPTGDRRIEFQPVADYIQPPAATVSIVSGEPATVVERTYYRSASPGSGALQVILAPAMLSDSAVPEAERAQWRLAGGPGSAWRDSGDVLGSLMPGNYLVECKPVPGGNTPPLTNATVRSGETATLTVTYFSPDPVPATAPGVLEFETVSTSRALPYAWVGQLRGSSGAYSGFVVKPRVVATVAQAVWNEQTLSVVSNLQWQFQRDRGTYEPRIQIPRGFYSFDGYAAQRQTENTPGTLALESQNRNAAALYFLEDAGRGGFSGFLASDDELNPFLTSTSSKLLAGYPARHIPPGDFGRMHSPPQTSEAFQKVLAHSYSHSSLAGGAGFIGGPVCVRLDGGAFFPAGIHLGGAQNLARAIDSRVIDLFGRAEVSSSGGDNNTGGGITHTSLVDIQTPDVGSLDVLIDPPEAERHGGGWRLIRAPSGLSNEERFVSSQIRNDLTPGDYIIEFNPVPGFDLPPDQHVTVLAGRRLEIVFDYGPRGTEQERWRLRYFGTAEPIGDASDGGDPDGDRRTNLEEFAARTSPVDSGDFFRIETLARSGSSFTATVPGRAGRRYELQLLVGPQAGVWQMVDSSAVLSEDQDVVLIHPTATTPRAIYRVSAIVAQP